MQQNVTWKSFIEFAGNSVLAGLFFAFVWYLYFYQPVAYVFFVAEDSWAEFGTFVFWLFTFFALIWGLVKYPDFRKPGHVMFALAAFFMAMEEVSWGQRIFQLETPGFFATHNYQKELSLHNFARSGQYYGYIGPLLWSDRSIHKKSRGR